VVLHWKKDRFLQPQQGQSKENGYWSIAPVDCMYAGKCGGFTVCWKISATVMDRNTIYSVGGLLVESDEENQNEKDKIYNNFTFQTDQTSGILQKSYISIYIDQSVKQGSWIRIETEKGKNRWSRTITGL